MTEAARLQPAHTLEPALRAGLDVLGLNLDDLAVDRLLRYLDLVSKWNRVYNLTAVRDPKDMLTQHLLDSLAVVRPLLRQCGPSGRLLDVGAGAGLPGVAIAIACPGWAVTCVDAVAKKASFVQQAAIALGLSNLQGVHSRIEAMATHEADCVTSRAFASLDDFTRLSRFHVKQGGVWMAMKGKLPDAEMAALPATVNVFHVEPLPVPGLDAERCLIWMRPQP